MAKDYTNTLNLPKTDFPMRANLPQREPDMLRYWEEQDLYHELLENAAGKKPFVLHDGPPFSNGNLHMGHALNKTLKDFINKSKIMEGYKVPFVPGWDNHGMPIESAIIKQNKIDRKKMSIPEFRNACRDFAQNFVCRQRDQFKRLGILADWDDPYLTMKPSFEAREVKVFGEMFRKGYIYKGLKPVYWCPHDETALAEAEIEYQTDRCTSIYVRFKIKDDKGRLASLCDLGKTYFVIWTTTPWTLPGNLAIALNPAEDYLVTRASDGNFYITAAALADKTLAAGGLEKEEVVSTLRGSEFEYMTASHPFLDRESLVVNADYVTMESGTGCVHIAPGFGADDYIVGRNYNMKIVVPVDDRGYQTADAGKFAGMYYEESNKAILDDMKESGALLAAEVIEHEYPHCWRCKHPIIFRATPQWFCSVDAFKDDAVKACENVEWIPAWGGERITQMIRDRADWCISRQRHWGLPIPVFYCEDCGKPVCNEETIESVSALFAEKGSNCWYELEAVDLLPKDFTCPHCGKKHFSKETDTLDGWFDSGSSHFSVLEGKENETWPADLYLEGADQYRGWFQSSLLTAVAAKGEGAPFRTVLTHGWTVDGEGKAMHKSLGNTVSPDEIVKKYGAELVRLWVASSDYRVDVRVSDAIFKQLSETYRKIRNTARILLANLGDFDPETGLLPAEELCEIDKWALTRVNELAQVARESYDKYEFHVLYHAVNNFCTTDLSKLYIDITKDRVYTEAADGKLRRAAQSTMWYILSALTRIIAPMISFTAEEIWQAMPHLASDNKKSVFLNPLPEVRPEWSFPELETHWDRLFALRDDVMKALELARAEKLIGKSLDADLTIYATDAEVCGLLDSFGEEALKTVFIVSDVKVKNEAAPAGAFTETQSGIGVLVEASQAERCDRCWLHDKNAVSDGDGHLCPRCAAIVNK
mgnify:FL=1